MTPLPTISNDCKTAVNTAAIILAARMDSPEARTMLYAIALQESRSIHRRQLIKNSADQLVPQGPAKGFWQFEKGGGATGVVRHPAARYWMHGVCEKYGILFKPRAIWDALETNDVVAAAAARLLLFTDPKRLPVVGDEHGAWALYLRVWRPGKPMPDTWPENYAAAVREVAL